MRDGAICSLSDRREREACVLLRRSVPAVLSAVEEESDAGRAERRRRQDLLGVVPDAAGTGPMNEDLGPDVPAWDSLTDDGRRLAARHMENYAAMVVSIDESVGRIREIQRRLGRLRVTSGPALRLASGLSDSVHVCASRSLSGTTHAGEVSGSCVMNTRWPSWGTSSCWGSIGA